MSDTMFAEPEEDEITEDISEEITPAPTPSDGGTLKSLPPPIIEEESESDRPPVESDSEGVMMAASPVSKKKYKESNKPVSTCSCVRLILRNIISHEFCMIFTLIEQINL